jgi:rhamnulokinase
VSYLAIDLGASSGRAVLGTLEPRPEGLRVATRDVHRFRVPMIEQAGHLYWDVDALWDDLRTAVAAALDIAPALQSVSVDSWAVDYVPLDADGAPLRLPYAYRDPRTRGRLAEVFRRVDAGLLYAVTGIQFLEFNTLPQIVADLLDEPELVARTRTRLLIADYFLYRLSGRPIAERTMASTTQLFDVRAGAWSQEVIRAAGDDPARWPTIVNPGTVLGPVLADALPAAARGAGRRPLVVASCSHDTAAAVAAVPASGEEPWAYISSGTWSLVGAELRAPVLTPAARRAGFTNEVGLDGTVRFLKNRTGMWVLEECLREWAADDSRVAWEPLFAEAAASSGGRAIDLDAPQFGERGGMVAKLEAACRDSGAPVPATRGEICRLVLESLADSYRRTLDELETLTGARARVLHVVGGGARNGLLNQLTADACGRRVVAGPEEATALGNILVQARALGDLPRGVAIRDVARASATLSEFLPRNPAPRQRPAVSAR